MKTATVYRNHRPVRSASPRRPVGARYPNEADRNDRLQSFLDGLLTVVTVVGGVTAVVFLLLL